MRRTHGILSDNSMSKFAVNTEAYEGPFEALLALINKKKLHISEVSLSQIADDYISYVRAHEFSLQDAASFVVVAATLAYIKSKALLPTFNLTDEEESDAEELQTRLRLYELFTAAAEKINSVIFTNTMFERIYRIPKKEIVFTPDPVMSIQNIEGAMKYALERDRKEEFVPQRSVAKQLTLKEVLDQISIRIKRFLRANFTELVVGGDKKSHAISFLAVLELYKQGYVDLSQDEQFGTIVVENTAIDTPHY